MSIPVYYYLEQEEASTFSEMKWAIRPLGDPLKGTPSWTKFDLPISSIINQITCLNDEMKQQLMSSMEASLRVKYLSQARLSNTAPVYKEEDLEKRVPGFTQNDPYVTFGNAPSRLEEGELPAGAGQDLASKQNDHRAASISSVGPPVRPEDLEQQIPGLNINQNGHRAASVSGRASRQNGHRAASVSSRAPPVHSEDDNLPTPARAGMGGWKRTSNGSITNGFMGNGSMRSPIQVKEEEEEDPSGVATQANTVKRVKKTNGDKGSANQIPTGPKKWDYFDKYGNPNRPPPSFRH